MQGSSKKFHVLILSRRCPHSKRAWDIVQNNGCAAAIKTVFVEDRTIALPPWVNKVPYFVTNTGYRYTDNDLFKFIQTILPQHIQNAGQKPTQISDNAPKDAGPIGSGGDGSVGGPAPYCDADGFSGNWSYIDSSSCGIEGTCAPIDKAYQTIETPNDDSVRTRKSDDSVLEKLMRQREKDIMRHPPPQ
jgi:hypothetical protein